ncbi:zinc-binding dehydrogenase [Niallia circulans]
MKVGDTIAILGAGPIGLLIALIAERAGAGKIFISDVSTMRLKIARDMGYEGIDAKTMDIVQIVKDSTNGVGADVVFEVAGNQITANQMIDCIKYQGKSQLLVFIKSPLLLILQVCILEKFHLRQQGAIVQMTLQKLLSYLASVI